MQKRFERLQAAIRILQEADEVASGVSSGRIDRPSIPALRENAYHIDPSAKIREEISASVQQVGGSTVLGQQFRGSERDVTNWSIDDSRPNPIPYGHGNGQPLDMMKGSRRMLATGEMFETTPSVPIRGLVTSMMNQGHADLARETSVTLPTGVVVKGSMVNDLANQLESSLGQHPYSDLAIGNIEAAQRLLGVPNPGRPSDFVEAAAMGVECRDSTMETHLFEALQGEAIPKFSQVAPVARQLDSMTLYKTHPEPLTVKTEDPPKIPKLLATLNPEAREMKERFESIAYQPLNRPTELINVTNPEPIVAPLSDPTAAEVSIELTKRLVGIQRQPIPAKDLVQRLVKSHRTENLGLQGDKEEPELDLLRLRATGMRNFTSLDIPDHKLFGSHTDGDKVVDQLREMSNHELAQELMQSIGTFPGGKIHDTYNSGNHRNAPKLYPVDADNYEQAGLLMEYFNILNSQGTEALLKAIGNQQCGLTPSVSMGRDSPIVLSVDDEYMKARPSKIEGLNEGLRPCMAMSLEPTVPWHLLGDIDITNIQNELARLEEMRCSQVVLASAIGVSRPRGAKADIGGGSAAKDRVVLLNHLSLLGAHQKREIGIKVKGINESQAYRLMQLLLQNDLMPASLQEPVRGFLTQRNHVSNVDDVFLKKQTAERLVLETEPRLFELQRQLLVSKFIEMNPLRHPQQGIVKISSRENIEAVLSQLVAKVRTPLVRKEVAIVEIRSPFILISVMNDNVKDDSADALILPSNRLHCFLIVENRMPSEYFEEDESQGRREKIKAKLRDREPLWMEAGRPIIEVAVADMSVVRGDFDDQNLLNVARDLAAHAVVGTPCRSAVLRESIWEDVSFNSHSLCLPVGRLKMQGLNDNAALLRSLRHACIRRKYNLHPRGPQPSFHALMEIHLDESTKCRNLDISKCKVDSEELDLIENVLKLRQADPALQAISIRAIESTDECFEQLLALLTPVLVRAEVVAVDAGHLKLNARRAKHLFSFLRSLASSLKHICLEGCGLSDTEAPFLLDILQAGEKLEVINIANNLLSDAFTVGCVELIRALREQDLLLIVSGNDMTMSSLEKLSVAAAGTKIRVMSADVPLTSDGLMDHHIAEGLQMLIRTVHQQPVAGPKHLLSRLAVFTGRASKVRANASSFFTFFSSMTNRRMVHEFYAGTSLMATEKSDGQGFVDMQIQAAAAQLFLEYYRHHNSYALTFALCPDFNNMDASKLVNLLSNCFVRILTLVNVKLHRDFAKLLAVHKPSSEGSLLQVNVAVLNVHGEFKLADAYALIKWLELHIPSLRCLNLLSGSGEAALESAKSSSFEVTVNQYEVLGMEEQYFLALQRNIKSWFFSDTSRFAWRESPLPQVTTDKIEKVIQIITGNKSSPSETNEVLAVRAIDAMLEEKMTIFLDEVWRAREAMQVRLDVSSVYTQGRPEFATVLEDRRNLIKAHPTTRVLPNSVDEARTLALKTLVRSRFAVCSYDQSSAVRRDPNEVCEAFFKEPRSLCLNFLGSRLQKSDLEALFTRLEAEFKYDKSRRQCRGLLYLGFAFCDLTESDIAALGALAQAQPIVEADVLDITGNRVSVGTPNISIQIGICLSQIDPVSLILDGNPLGDKKESGILLGSVLVNTAFNNRRLRKLSAAACNLGALAISALVRTLQKAKLEGKLSLSVLNVGWNLISLHALQEFVPLMDSFLKGALKLIVTGNSELSLGMTNIAAGGGKVEVVVQTDSPPVSEDIQILVDGLATGD